MRNAESHALHLPNIHINHDPPLLGFATACGIYHLAAIFAAHAAIGTTIGGLVHYTATAKSCHAKERSASCFSFAGALGR